MPDKKGNEVIIKQGLQIFTPEGEAFIVGKSEYEISYFSLIAFGSKKETKQIHGIGTGLTIPAALRDLASNLENTEIVIDLDLGREDGD